MGISLAKGGIIGVLRHLRNHSPEAKVSRVHCSYLSFPDGGQNDRIIDEHNYNVGDYRDAPV